MYPLTIHFRKIIVDLLSLSKLYTTTKNGETDAFLYNKNPNMEKH